MKFNSTSFVSLLLHPRDGDGKGRGKKKEPVADVNKWEYPGPNGTQH